MSVRLKSSAKVSAEDVLAFQLQLAEHWFVRQIVYAAPRRFEADFAVWAKADGTLPDKRWAWLVEVQGGVFNRRAHGSVTGVLADIERSNVAALAGWRMLRVTPQMVDSGEALRLIEKALAERTKVNA